MSSDSNLLNEKRKEIYNENTPLNISIENENLKIIKLLLNHKNINMNVKSNNNIWTYWASEHRCYSGEETEEKEYNGLLL